MSTWRYVWAALGGVVGVWNLALAELQEQGAISSVVPPAISACVGMLCLGSAVLDLWRLRRGRELESLAGIEVKRYPVGCTCIRGALLDNPSCPHHRGEP